MRFSGELSKARKRNIHMWSGLGYSEYFRMRNVSHLLHEQEYTEQVYTGGPNFDGQSAINRLKSQKHSSTWLGGEVSHWMWGKHEKYMRDYSRVVGRIQEELWNKGGNTLHTMKRRYSGFVGLGQKVWLEHLE